MTTTTTSFATARDVSAALITLGYQASTETIGAISRNCRDEFLDALSRCITDNDPDAVGRKLIDTLMRSLAPASVKKLQAIVPTATIDMIVPIARTVPTRFLSAIDAANEEGHARQEDAKAYLRSIFEAPAPADAPPSPPPAETGTAQAKTPAPAPTPAAPSTRSAPSQPPVAAARDEKYNSVHVYGGSYALCFNAGEWKGQPGVMVDAAASSGPKTYDWENALHIWLDLNEVGAVLAVFRRYRKGIEFRAHGAQNDKAFSIEFQDTHFFAKASSSKAAQHPTRAVKILPTDATAVSLLFMQQLVNAYPAIPATELLATVRATHQPGNNANAAQN